jgi:hypothetical protein
MYWESSSCSEEDKSSQMVSGSNLTHIKGGLVVVDIGNMFIGIGTQDKCLKQAGQGTHVLEPGRTDGICEHI